jgi:hypothetical protein
MKASLLIEDSGYHFLDLFLFGWVVRFCVAIGCSRPELELSISRFPGDTLHVATAQWSCCLLSGFVQVERWGKGYSVEKQNGGLCIVWK